MVSLSVKNVPDALARALRKRAKRNHRSIQGELMHILESSLRPRIFDARALAARVRELGLTTENDSAALVRDARDSR
jgi:plasmid stability protein